MEVMVAVQDDTLLHALRVQLKEFLPAEEGTTTFYLPEVCYLHAFERHRHLSQSAEFTSLGLSCFYSCLWVCCSLLFTSYFRSLDNEIRVGSWACIITKYSDQVLLAFLCAKNGIVLYATRGILALLLILYSLFPFIPRLRRLSN